MIRPTAVNINEGQGKALPACLGTFLGVAGCLGWEHPTPQTGSTSGPGLPGSGDLYAYL